MLLLFGGINKPIIDWSFLGGLPSGLTFSRASNATMFDSTGKLVWAPANMLLNSATLSTQSVTVVSGQSYTLSFYDMGSVALSGGGSGTLAGTGANDRVSTSFTASSTSVTFTVSGTVTNAQLEPTSYNSPQPYNTTTSAAYYGPRFDYNPSTLVARGLLIEEQRTNNIRNNTMSGAATGTPGTLPTNWSIIYNPAGLSRQVVGFGTVNGIPYIDIRIYGTASGTSFQMGFEQSQQIAASLGQTWTGYFYAAVVGGTLNGVSNVYAQINEQQASTFLRANSVSFVPTETLTRYTNTMTTQNSSITTIAMMCNLTTTNGAAIDVTLRIAAPQMELSAFGSSIILSSGVTTTRAADTLYATSIPWFNATEGTFYVSGIPQYSTPSHRSYFVGFDDGTANNIITSFIETDGKPIGGDAITDGTVYLSGDSLSVVSANTLIKTARTYKSNANYFAANGIVDTDGTLKAVGVPTVNNMKIGYGIIADRQFNGWLQSFKYWSRALSTTELQKVTT